MGVCERQKLFWLWVQGELMNFILPIRLRTIRYPDLGTSSVCNSFARQKHTCT